MTDDPERRELADLVECRVELAALRAKLKPMALALRAWLERHPPELPHQELDAFFSAILDEPVVADAATTHTAQPSPSQDDRERARIAYVVELDKQGCECCGAGNYWTVVGPDDVGISQSFADRCVAEDTAELMNSAFAAGRKDQPDPSVAHAAGYEAAIRALRDAMNPRWADYLAAHAPTAAPEDNK